MYDKWKSYHANETIASDYLPPPTQPAAEFLHWVPAYSALKLVLPCHSRILEVFQIHQLA